MVYIYIRVRTKKLQRDKEELEREVKSRTSEVVLQKDIIERKNKDITDSITYAKRIQQAILPTEQVVKKLFPKSFVLYKPKDIVSGDFYWMEQVGSQNFVAAVDCTGHGVPGAFMSIVGYNLLNQAVNERGIYEPAKILDEMNNGLSKQLRQQGDSMTVRDGMDLSLCSFDIKTNVLQYAGANNSLWLVRNNELHIVKADKCPIGTYVGETLKSFTNHSIQLQEGDLIYLFTDGYADQFGGKDGKKFKYKQLQQVILEMNDKQMDVQLQVLENTINNWRGDLEQVDDILIVGIKV